MGKVTETVSRGNRRRLETRLIETSVQMKRSG